MVVSGFYYGTFPTLAAAATFVEQSAQLIKSIDQIRVSLLGQPLGSDDVLVVYIYNGDVDLNGKVDLADYFLIDSAFIGQTGPRLPSNPRPTALRDGGAVQSAAKEVKSDSILSQLFSMKPVL